MAMDDDLRSLVRTSVRQAIQQPADQIDGALAAFGWRDLAATDPALAITALFEEQGHLAVSTAALDLLASEALALDDDVTVIWSHRSTPSGRRRRHRPVPRARAGPAHARPRR